MGYSSLTLVTDAELGAIEPEATSAKMPWNSVTWPNQRAEAKRDLKIWLEADFASIPGVSDRVKDTHAPSYVFAYTGSAFSDKTTEGRDDIEEDVALATIFTTVGTDRLYIGADWEYEGLLVKLVDSVNAIASVLTAKYWGPTGWTSLSATDGTASSGKTFAKTGRITWNIPKDWERRVLNGTADAFYWVELSISVALTAGTSATQILPVRAPDGLKRVCALRAMGYIFRGLAAQTANPERWLARVNNTEKTGYWDQADALYAQLRDKGGIPLDLTHDDALDSGEAKVVSPLRIGRS